ASASYAAAFTPCAAAGLPRRLPSSASPPLRLARTKKTCDTAWPWMSSAIMRAPDAWVVVVTSSIRADRSWRSKSTRSRRRKLSPPELWLQVRQVVGGDQLAVPVAAVFDQPGLRQIIDIDDSEAL